MSKEVEIPEVDDEAVLKVGDFLQKAKCIRNPVDGDLYWETDTGARIDFRKAKIQEKIKKVEQVEAQSEVKVLETVADDESKATGKAGKASKAK